MSFQSSAARMLETDRISRSNVFIGMSIVFRSHLRLWWELFRVLYASLVLVACWVWETVVLLLCLASFVCLGFFAFFGAGGGASYFLRISLHAFFAVSFFFVVANFFDGGGDQLFGERGVAGEVGGLGFDDFCAWGVEGNVIVFTELRVVRWADELFG